MMDDQDQDQTPDQQPQAQGDVFHRLAGQQPPRGDQGAGQQPETVFHRLARQQGMNPLPSGPPKTQQEYDQGFQDFANAAAKYAPGTLAAIGGIAAGPEFWPAVGYSALGALAGSGIKQGTQLVTGSPEAPQSIGEGALTAGKDVGENVAAEALGRGVAAPFEWAAGKLAPKAVQLYRTALRPGVSMGPAAANEVAQTGLKEAIPVSEKGYWTARGRIDQLNDLVQKKIDAKSAELGAVIDPEHVAQQVDQRMPWAQTQVNPEADVEALLKSKAEFMRQHTTQAPYTQLGTFTDPAEAEAMGSSFYPTGQGSTAVPEPMTLSEAQALKQGTYQRLRQNYGEIGSANVEAQKALARGLRQDIVASFPELQKLNARDAALIDLEQALQKHAINTGRSATYGPAIGGALMGHSAEGIALSTLWSAYKNPAVRSKLAIALHRAATTQLPRKALTVGAHALSTQMPDTITVRPQQSYAPTGGFQKGGPVHNEEVDRLSRRGLDRGVILRSLGA